MVFFGLVGGEHVDLLIAVDGVPQAQSGTKLQIALLKSALEKQNRPAPSELTDPLRLLKVQQGKPVRPTKPLEDALNAVSIRIGFDHGPDFGMGHGMAYALQIVLKGLGMYLGKDGTRHRA